MNLPYMLSQNLVHKNVGWVYDLDNPSANTATHISFAKLLIQLLVRVSDHHLPFGYNRVNGQQTRKLIM
jgi:hypothetical protein